MKIKWMAFIIVSLLLIETLLLLTLYQIYKTSRQYDTDIFLNQSSHTQTVVPKYKEIEDDSIVEMPDETVEEPLGRFYVMQEEKIINHFETFEEALAFADNYDDSCVYFTETQKGIWCKEDVLSESVQIHVNPIQQMPELARGCEVTSLAMLLNHAGLDVSKMTLAEEIAKNPIPITYQNGKVYAGDMNEGFLGDIYSFQNDGLGVYHRPIYHLAQQYLGDDALNISDFDFEHIYRLLNRGYPVWIITTSTFSPLPESSFQTWYTPDETPMRVTYKEHSVLVTGYDQNNVYFNDPLSGHSKSKKQNFIAAWEQMGKQAITYTKMFSIY